MYILGEVDEENDIDQDKDWSDYWRLLFKKVSVKDIEEFEEKYKGEICTVSCLHRHQHKFQN